MQLWTHHPSRFQIDAVDLVVDPTQGEHWHMEARNFRYRDVLRALCGRLGTSQFLWCCTRRGQFRRLIAECDLVEWELNVPESQILAFIRGRVWEDIVWSRSDDWGELIIEERPELADPYINALVRVPLLSEWVTCHGQLPLPVTHLRR